MNSKSSVIIVHRALIFDRDSNSIQIPDGVPRLIIHTGDLKLYNYGYYYSK